MRWLDDVSTDLRKIGINEWRERERERESKGSRGLEAYCKGGQGPPRAVAPPKKKKKKKKRERRRRRSTEFVKDSQLIFTNP